MRYQTTRCGSSSCKRLSRLRSWASRSSAVAKMKRSLGSRGAVRAHGQVTVLEFDLCQSLLSPEIFAHQIEGDRKQPGAEALVGVEVCAGAVQLQEGLLHQITRVLRRW